MGSFSISRFATIWKALKRAIFIPIGRIVDAEEIPTL